ncbi:hypothetical protein BJ973_000309 [Actinoplanes tereljensis]|uniref:Uncharacterized protein n=1 Tax=Paractinoplanes tereljensis TaxID=571912 RepID=A0A919NRG5_9ACTN|nr:hypothetical protein [Actinoplanes tereljensis]GIF23333.1 hypothetical protein Ate02nite_60630 [Actinoplanes tereljensis]
MSVQIAGQRDRRRRLGCAVGRLAVSAYERNVGGVVVFEKDAAKIAPFRWLKDALTLSAELSEAVGTVYVRAARRVTR